MVNWNFASNESIVAKVFNKTTQQHAQLPVVGGINGTWNQERIIDVLRTTDSNELLVTPIGSPLKEVRVVLQLKATGLPEIIKGARDGRAEAEKKLDSEEASTVFEGITIAEQAIQDYATALSIGASNSDERKTLFNEQEHLKQRLNRARLTPLSKCFRRNLQKAFKQAFQSISTQQSLSKMSSLKFAVISKISWTMILRARICLRAKRGFPS